MTVEQGRAQRFLQRANLAADGRLAQVKTFAGMGKATGVRDCVAWRRSPAMEDLAGAADGADIDAGIEDGSAVRGVAENAEWVQAENGYWLPKKLVRRVRSWMPAAGVDVLRARGTRRTARAAAGAIFCGNSCLRASASNLDAAIEIAAQIQ